MSLVAVVEQYLILYIFYLFVEHTDPVAYVKLKCILLVYNGIWKSYVLCSLKLISYCILVSKQNFQPTDLLRAYIGPTILFTNHSMYV